MHSENTNENKEVIHSHESETKKLYVTWQEIEILVKQNAKKIKGVEDIHPIPRGGLVLGVILSHNLGLPFAKKITRKTLIVDEICDSGKTFVRLEKKLGYKPKTFVLHKKTISDYEPTITCQVLDTKDWIVYPWENV